MLCPLGLLRSSGEICTRSEIFVRMNIAHINHGDFRSTMFRINNSGKIHMGVMEIVELRERSDLEGCLTGTRATKVSKLWQAFRV